MKTKSFLIIAITCLMFFCPLKAEEHTGVVCGSWIEIAAHPFKDFHFVKWSDENTDSIRQIQVHEDATYIAFFAANCEEYANWPVVALYDWLLMVDVRQINQMGYYFTPANVTWYRVVGEADDMHNDFPQDDQIVTTGSYYLTLNQNLSGTGNYYAVVDVSNAQGMLCDGLMRSVIIQYASKTSHKSALALMPSAARPGQDLKIVGLNPSEQAEIYIYSAAGQLVEVMQSTGQTTFYFPAQYTAGSYQVKVVSPSHNQVLRYIVHN